MMRFKFLFFFRNLLDETVLNCQRPTAARYDSRDNISETSMEFIKYPLYSYNTIVSCQSCPDQQQDR